MKTNSWTTAAQAKDISSSPNPLVKVLRRGRHWVWGPNRRRAIKECKPLIILHRPQISDVVYWISTACWAHVFKEDVQEERHSQVIACKRYQALVLHFVFTYRLTCFTKQNGHKLVGKDWISVGLGLTDKRNDVAAASYSKYILNEVTPESNGHT